jgi:hypothetical protein
MAEWMAEFEKYLAYENPALVETDSSKESVVDQARACGAWLRRNPRTRVPRSRGCRLARR